MSQLSQLQQQLYEEENLDDIKFTARRGDIPKVEGTLRKSSQIVKSWFSKYGLTAITLPKEYIVDEMPISYEQIPTRRGVATLVAGHIGGQFNPENLAIQLNIALIPGTREYERLIGEYERSLRTVEEILEDPYENPDLKTALEKAKEFYRSQLRELRGGEEATYTVVHEILHLVLVAAFGIPLVEQMGFVAIDNRPIVEGFNELATYEASGKTGNPETTYGMYASRISTVLKEDLGYNSAGDAIASYLKRGLNGLHVLGTELKEAYRRRFGVEYINTLFPF